MKKILMLTAVFAGVTCFASPKDTIITFSTRGPDRYADGSAVLDGECYALVWTANGATFGGFAANGTLLSDQDKLVVVAGLAKGGRCPTTLFEIPVADADDYANGTFALYLLDTRAYDAKGQVTVGLKGQASATAPGAVNGFASTSDSGAALAVETEVGNPTISSILVGDATITLTVGGLEPTVKYSVAAGPEPSNLLNVKEDAAREGDTFTFGKADGENFFRVIGTRPFGAK